MVAKLKEQPLCRYCGKPIRKHTIAHYRPATGGGWKNLEEVKRHFNEQITAHKWSKDRETGERTEIWCVYTWDGETYEDDIFCSTTTCAVRMAYAAVLSKDLAMPAWVNAMRARKQGGK